MNNTKTYSTSKSYKFKIKNMPKYKIDKKELADIKSRANRTINLSGIYGEADLISQIRKDCRRLIEIIENGIL
ncbi:MAG: hypothetical protein AABY22_33695 [Nanoarchaeota archaeon]